MLEPSLDTQVSHPVLLQPDEGCLCLQLQGSEHGCNQATMRPPPPSVVLTWAKNLLSNLSSLVLPLHFCQADKVRSRVCQADKVRSRVVRQTRSGLGFVRQTRSGLGLFNRPQQARADCRPACTANISLHVGLAPYASMPCHLAHNMLQVKMAVASPPQSAVHALP